MLSDALMAVYEASAIQSPKVMSDLFRKINAFTDRILITIMETYDAYDRTGQ